MKKNLFAVSAFLLAVLVAGCPGKDDDKKDPSPPTLGTQIDRMGRPAISTATIATFEADPTAKGAAKDAYNAAAPAMWATFTTSIAASLAVLDSIDEDCGNQLLFTTAGGYALAGVLADDRLWINSVGTCTEGGQAYLAVEANATGVLTNDLCGGRTLSMDIAETSYSVLALGAIEGADDGVAADDATHSLTAFPFVAAPLP